MIRRHIPQIVVVAALVLAATAGVLASAAFGVGQQAPTSTVTVDVGTGARGPTGPQGVAGSPGAESCPTGSTFKAVVFVQQSKGPTTIFTCVAD